MGHPAPPRRSSGRQRGWDPLGRPRPTAGLAALHRSFRKGTSPFHGPRAPGGQPCERQLKVMETGAPRLPLRPRWLASDHLLVFRWSCRREGRRGNVRGSLDVCGSVAEDPSLAASPAASLGSVSTVQQGIDWVSLGKVLIADEDGGLSDSSVQQVLQLLDGHTADEIEAGEGPRDMSQMRQTTLHWRPHRSAPRSRPRTGHDGSWGAAAAATCPRARLVPQPRVWRWSTRGVRKTCVRAGLRCPARHRRA